MGKMRTFYRQLLYNSVEMIGHITKYKIVDIVRNIASNMVFCHGGF
jgi:hypothetical protein